MLKKHAEWLNKLEEIEGISLADVYDFLRTGNPTLVNGVPLNYSVESCGDNHTVKVWSNDRKLKSEVSGSEDQEAPYGYGWFHLLYKAVARLFSKTRALEPVLTCACCYTQINDGVIHNGRPYCDNGCRDEHARILADNKAMANGFISVEEEAEHYGIKCC
jgi:hypothetical protein